MFVKVTLKDAKEDVDKVCIEVQKTSDNAGGKPIRDFSLQQKTFSALNYARDFGATMKESLKRTRNRSGLPRLTKTRIVPCQIRSCLGQQSKLPLPPVQIVTREDKGLNRELLTCLTTNYKKRINSR